MGKFPGLNVQQDEESAKLATPQKYLTTKDTKSHQGNPPEGIPW